MSPAKVCKGPSSVPGQVCGRATVAHGLCVGHDKQTRRGRVLTPLAGPHGRDATCSESKVRVSTRLSPKAAEAVQGVGQRMNAAEREELGRGAAAVLEAWARGELVVKWKRKTPHLLRE